MRAARFLPDNLPDIKFCRIIRINVDHSAG